MSAHSKHHQSKKEWLPFIFVGLLLVIIGGLYAIKPGKVFPQGSGGVTVVRVAKGETLGEVGELLAKEGVVRFAWPAGILLTLFGGKEGVHAGAYVISANTPPLQALWQIASGDFGVDSIKVTVPEGATSYQIAELLEGHFIDFNTEKFKILAKAEEGYLFPDTYFFLPTATEEEIVALMEENFKAKIAPLLPVISASGKGLSDTIIIAALLEREARSVESKRMIAGIIDNRLKEEMPLQIDAVFGYIKETETFSPKHSDLTIDSPYNTYTNKGLPPGPISNPGFDSILAAATPIDSSYLYYLTGRDGVMRYAKTFADHVTNRRKYLD